jgi:hypothetical protein
MQTIRVVACFVALSLAATAAVFLSAPPASAAATAYPNAGWTIHVDAKRHVPGNPDFVVHHFCRNVAGGWLECQLYDSDAPDARLIGVETIVPADVWQTFPATEKPLWHYHRDEIPKVSAVMPDVSADVAAKTVASLYETYGKIYLFWDPSAQSMPTGWPFVSILH